MFAACPGLTAGDEVVVSTVIGLDIIQQCVYDSGLVRHD